MTDAEILSLYETRDPQAIAETKACYGRLIYAIAFAHVPIKEDAEEIENDVYLDLWQAIPPARPDPLSPFCAMLARRRALDTYRRLTAEKRVKSSLSLSELDECIQGGRTFAEETDAAALTDCLNRFLKRLPEEECLVFLRRYFFGDSIKAIAKHFACGQSRIKMMLKRTRDSLRIQLEKEGFLI